MAKERQENLLNNLFSVVPRQAKGNHVTEQRIAEQAEEVDNLLFTLRLFVYRSRGGTRRERYFVRGVCRRSQHGSLYIYSALPPSVQSFFAATAKNTEQNRPGKNIQAEGRRTQFL